ncbi:CoA transferase [Streptomyces sp. TRM 70361]|uniref:CoA transferase n=1 Tax=Streptomyces sp. TRM 70361 TaxID=3116553 RepID=UPI002E7C2829|nr:CoA transferase [Streptomyces sp. TRM 70361]MEE1938043.1 CoA transferase [Streptomyces sp. TRM 70361]
MRTTVPINSETASGTPVPEAECPVREDSGPLAGHTVLYTGRIPAADVALRHLSCLGATPLRQPAEEADGGTLRLTPPGAGEPSLTCRLTWSCQGGREAADETTVQAVTGMMAVHGRRRGVPTRLPVDYASACAGVLAVHGVLASLIARERGADISRTGTSVTHAALLTVCQYLAAATADEEEFLPADSPEAGPPFRSRDGVWFEVEALDPVPWQSFWTELGVPRDDIRRAWRPFVLRYPKAVCPLPPSLSAAVRSRDFAGLAALADRTGMSVCRVRTLDERRGDSDAVLGGRVLPPWRFTPYGDPAAAVPAGSGAGASPTPDAPLRGLTVVEAGRRIQAPMATRVTSLLGARVVRIEPLDGDPLRGMPPMAGDCSARFTALNKGKEVVHADLKSPAGRAAVLDLAREADAFLHNWAPGKAAVFGLDSDDLLAVNPRLVYAHSSGWGDALGEHPPLGTDFMAQAHSGLADMMAVDGSPRPSLMTMIDVLGGLVAAEGLLAGLLRRERTGRGLRVDSSLLSASTVLQYQEIERPRNRSAHGCGTAGAPVLDGPWETARGWLALSARSHTSVGRLCRLLGLVPSASESVLRKEVAARLAERPADEWTGVLAAAGVSSAVVATDLRLLDRSPAARPALARDECVLVTAPWRFDA